MTRNQVIDTIRQAREECLKAGLEDAAKALGDVLAAFDSMPSTAGAILGSKGGNTPVKPGSRPRGRPKTKRD